VRGKFSAYIVMDRYRNRSKIDIEWIIDRPTMNTRL
jgi:hypothetical protein